MMIQREITLIARQDAWISMLLGGIVSLGTGLLLYLLVQLYPGRDFPLIILEIGGKFLGRLLLLPLTLYVLFTVGFTLDIFAHALKVFLLDRTPTLVITTSMVFICISVVKRGIYSISSVLDLLFPIFILTFLLLTLLACRNCSFEHLKPILYKNTFNTVKGILPSYKVFVGTGVIAYVLRYSIDTKASLKWFLLGMLLSIAIYTMLTLTAILTFGYQETQLLMYPTLAISKSIDFPSTLVERLETLIAVIWISVTFAFAVLYSFASIRNIMVLLGLKPRYYTLTAYAHIPVLIAITMMGGSILRSLSLLHAADYLGVALGLVFTPLLTLTALFKKRKEKKR